MSQERLVPTEKTALVTHRGCLDGTGSALMFIWAGGRRENVLFRNPSQCNLSPTEAAPYDEVWFADLCPPSMDEPGGGKPFRVFDHHLSNQRKHGDDTRCTFDLTRSGTSLMAHVLGIPAKRDPYVDDLIEALEAYDLGRFDVKAGVRLADIASSYTQDEMLDVLLTRDPTRVLWDSDLTARAEALASVRNLYAEQAARNAIHFEMWSDGENRKYVMAVACSPVYWKNTVAQTMLGREGVDVAMVIDTTTQMASLRSLEGGPDCSRIAGQYGGGGHARAAGFKINGPGILSAISHRVLG